MTHGKLNSMNSAPSTATHGLRDPYVMDKAIGARITEPSLAGQTIRAYVRGIPLGEAVVGPGTTDGELIIPINRFPWVSLPCEIRLAGADGLDAAPVLVLTRSEQVYRLAGPGTIEDVDIRIDGGQINGTAANRINGFNAPMLIGRVNGAGFRPINVQPVRPRGDGGCSITFSMKLERDDFSAEGAHYEVLFLPSMTSIWSMTLAPAESTAPDLMLEIQERLTSAERRTSIAISNISARLDSEIERQNQVVQNVTAYLSSLILDRINASLSGHDESATIARKIIEAARLEAGTIGAASHSVVGVESPFLGAGWSRVKEDKRRIHVRWMASTATLFNPHPDRPVASIILTISDTHDQLLERDLTVLCDGQPSDITVTPSDQTPCTVTISPAAGDRVHLVALLASPNTSTDPEQKLALVDATFRYRD